MNRYISQHFAVDFYRCFFQTVHKTAVRQTTFTRGSINTGNPQLAELSFSLPAVTVSILTRLNNGLFGDPVNTTAGAVITLGRVALTALLVYPDTWTKTGKANANLYLQSETG